MTVRRPPLPQVLSPKLGNVRFSDGAAPSADPAVAVEDGALVLRQSSSLDDARFERAQVLLSSALYAAEAPASQVADKKPKRARAGDSSRTPSALDIERSLTNLYPSLGVARLLGQHEALQGGVADFLKSLDVPEAILSHVKRAVLEFEVDGSPSIRRASPEGDGEYQGFRVATGPLVESASISGIEYRSTFYKDETRSIFFRTAATDENLMLPEVQAFGGWNLVSWHHGGTTPSDIINFTARRLEIYPNGASHIEARSALLDRKVRTGGRMFFSDECVPALLRLAKACSADLDAIVLDDGKTLRQRATELKLFAPGNEEDLAGRETSALSSTFRATTDERLDALAAWLGEDDEVSALGNLVAHAKELSARGELGRFDWSALSVDQRDALVDVLTSVDQLDGVPVLAGILVTSWPKAARDALRDQIESEWNLDVTEDADTWVDRAKRFSALSDDARTRVLEGLEESSPDFPLFPLRLELAERKTLKLPYLEALFAEYEEHDAAGTLRLFAEAAGTGDERSVNAVRRFFVQGLEDGTLEQADVQHALSDGRWGRLFTDRSLKEVDAAVEEVRKADVVTREAAVATLVEKLQGVSPVFSKGPVVSSALHSLYEDDLKHIAPLSEAASRVGTTRAEPFTDLIPFTERVASGQLDTNIEGLAMQNPRLAHEVEVLKMRLVVTLDESTAADLPVRVEQAAYQLLERWPNLDEATQNLIASHLQSWAVDRQLQFAAAV